jgi:prolyl 4-hydroxylase
LTRLAERLNAERVVWRDGFLTAEACAEILDELEFAFWWPSTVLLRSPGGDLVSAPSSTRRSATTSQFWFTTDLNRMVATIERRLCRMFGFDRGCLEQWQATRYGYRDRFQPHNDGGLFSDEQAGERVLTLMVCLCAPAEGGATQFPQRRLVVAPQVGRLLIWRNLRDDGRIDPSMLHGSMPVRRGHKVILVTWCRERSIRQQ